MGTLVAHGCELPMFFDQQGPATPQIDLSHPVKHTKPNAQLGPEH